MKNLNICISNPIYGLKKKSHYGENGRFFSILLLFIYILIVTNEKEI